MVDYSYLSDTYEECLPDEATRRAPATLFRRYRDARAKLAAVEAELEVRSERPLIVTPEQEPALRAAAKPGTWFIVGHRSPAAEVPPTANDLPETPSLPEQQTPPQEATRPPLPACPQHRGGVHVPARYVYNADKTVDALCSCGIKMHRVACPHMHQRMRGKNVLCDWCDKVIIRNTGAPNLENNMAGALPAEAAMVVDTHAWEGDL